MCDAVWQTVRDAAEAGAATPAASTCSQARTPQNTQLRGHPTRLQLLSPLPAALPCLFLSCVSLQGSGYALYGEVREAQLSIDPSTAAIGARAGGPAPGRACPHARPACRAAPPPLGHSSRWLGLGPPHCHRHGRRGPPVLQLRPAHAAQVRAAGAGLQAPLGARRVQAGPSCAWPGTAALGLPATLCTMHTHGLPSCPAILPPLPAASRRRGA